MSKQKETQYQKAQQKNWHHTLYTLHEAEHAVVGHVIGRCVAEVSIVGDRSQGYHG